jgi:hypothetical protein
MGNSVQTHKHAHTHKKFDRIERHVQNLYEKNEIKLDENYREVPIDCSLAGSDDIINEQEPNNEPKDLFLNNQEDKLHIDFLFRNQPSANKTDNQLQFIDLYSNGKLDSNAINNNRFTRRTSLSTIFEEKSQLSSANMSCFSEKIRVKSYNDVHMINNLLDDFHDKTQVINEIMHVFEPSSKYGAFRRNIPIRLSSKLKYEKLLQSTSSLVFTPSSRHSLSTNSVNSKFSPISYNRASERPSIDNDFLLSCIQKEPIIFHEPKSNRNVYTMIAESRRARFLRRLKKHIENIRGSKCNAIRAINYSNEYRQHGKNLHFEINEPKLFNFQMNEHDNLYEDRRNAHQHEYYVQTNPSQDKLSSLHIIYENNGGDHRIFSSKLLVKTDVNPVYF